MEALLELRWMLPACAISLVLVGIHGYLGIHVLTRKVIFVDLALAQIAALGSAYAVLLGYDPDLAEDGAAIYAFSLAFTFLGAAVFALTRMRHERVPHEAFIGITYATASALAILVLARTPGESEHLKSMLVGNILLVGWAKILETAGIYAAVSVVLALFHGRLLAISVDPEGAAAQGTSLRLWDFLFYVIFGFVITSSVAIAGVLLVFTYLVVPASFAMLFAETFRARLALAWGTGTACTLAGMVLSYYGDLPTGPAVVGVFAAALAIGGVARAIAGATRPARAAAWTLVATLLLVLGARASLTLGKPPPEHAHESDVERLLAALDSDDEDRQIEAIHHLAERQEPHARPAIERLVQRTASARVLEHGAEALAALGDASAVPALLGAARRDLDSDLRLAIAEAVFRLRDPRGVELLLAALRDDPPLLARRRAGAILESYFAEDFGYDPSSPSTAAIARIEAWWKKRADSLRWRNQAGRFE